MKCDYSLWNLASRECPECGTPFKPSEFEFRPNTVRFCCPHCDQAYYGTSLSGALVPAAFACVQCGRDVHMDDMVLRPAEGVDESQTLLTTMPWLARHRGQRVGKWFGTIGRSMVSPIRLMASVPSDSGSGQAWWYAIVTLVIVLAAGALLPALVGGILIMLLSSSGDGGGVIVFGLSVFGILGVAFLLILALWGLVTHAVLHFTGGTAYPLGRTYQAFGYSIGANITLAVPCIGIYPFMFVGLLWWLVSAVLMVAEAHKVRGGRATFAVLLFPIVLVVVGTASLVGLTMWGMNQAGVAMQAAVVQQQTGEIQIMTDAIREWSGDHDGLGPDHALRLVTVSGVGAPSFAAAGTTTYWEEIEVADQTLATVPDLTFSERADLFAAAAASLPDDAVAHRLGDFVFTYDGIDLNNDDGDLWIVVVCPAPELSQVMETTYAVGTVDGSVSTFGEFEFDAALAEQNDLRSECGLAPLPRPEDVGVASSGTD